MRKNILIGGLVAATCWAAALLAADGSSAADGEAAVPPRAGIPSIPIIPTFPYSSIPGEVIVNETCEE